jgi:hypothetical protein
MRSGAEFESYGEEYLKTPAVGQALYESPGRGEVVRL